MTGGVTLEQVEGWGGDLPSFISMTDGLFARPEARANFSDFIVGLLAAVVGLGNTNELVTWAHAASGRLAEILSRVKLLAQDLRFDACGSGVAGGR